MLADLCLILIEYEILGASIPIIALCCAKHNIRLRMFYRIRGKIRKGCIGYKEGAIGRLTTPLSILDWCL
jgi:hypothetical protein